MEGFYDDLLAKLMEQRKVLIEGEIEINQGVLEKLVLLATTPGDIELIICSPGGDVFYAVAIIEQIRRVQSEGHRVTGRVAGQAASAAATILQVCDQRVISPTGLLMVHGTSIETFGDKRAMKSTQRQMDIYNEMFAGIFAQRTGYKTHEWWLELYQDANPIYYTAWEALENNLVDHIEEYHPNANLQQGQPAKPKDAVRKRVRGTQDRKDRVRV